MKRPVLLEGGWIVSKHPYHNDPSGYKTAKEVRIGEFEDGQEAHVNMMDFRVGDETMSWFRDAYPLVERFISEGGIVVSRFHCGSQRDKERDKNKNSTSLEQFRLGILSYQYTTMESEIQSSLCLIESRQSDSLLLSGQQYRFVGLD